MVICARLLLAPFPYNLIPFALIGGGAFVFVTLRYPIVGLHLYLIIFLIRPQELFPQVGIMHYPYEKVVGIIVIVSLIFTYLVRGRNFELFDIDKGVLLFAAAVAVSVVPALWVTGSKDIFIIFFKVILAYLFTARIVDTQKKYRGIIWLYVLSVGFIAVSTTINYYTGNYEIAQGIQRAAGVGGKVGARSDPNSMAATLVLGLPFVFFVMKSYRSRLVWLLLGAIFLVSLWTIVISGSRGGMLGGIVMLTLLAMTTRYKVPALVVGVLLIAGIAAVMPEQYVERFASIARYDVLDDGTGAAHSAQGRIKGLKIGFEILLERPLTGVGIGCFGLYNYQHHGSWLQAHNLPGQLMGELGLLGLLAFGYFVYKLISNIKSVRSKLRTLGRFNDFTYHMVTACAVSVGLLFFMGLFGHNLYRFNWYLIAAFVAIMGRLVQQRFDQPRADASEKPDRDENVSAAR
jgi:O-antigen ligase